jgi:hypothetical protein
VIDFTGVLIIPGTQKASPKGRAFDQYIKSQLLIYLPKVRVGSQKASPKGNQEMWKEK